MAPPKFVRPLSPPKAWDVDVTELVDFEDHLAQHATDIQALLNLEKHTITEGHIDCLADALHAQMGPEPHDTGHMALARLHARRGRFNEAELACRTILRQNLNHVPSLLCLADVCQQKSNLRDAILALHKVLSIDTGHGGAAFRLGELYWAQGNRLEAIKWFTQAEVRLVASGDVAGAEAARARRS